MELKGHPDGIEAVALWKGNRRERGHVTGFLYPRSGNNNRLLVHPADLEATPHLFQKIVRREPGKPDWVPNDSRDSFKQFVQKFGAVMGYETARPGSKPKLLGSVGEPAPDVDKLLKLYREHMVTRDRDWETAHDLLE